MDDQIKAVKKWTPEEAIKMARRDIAEFNLTRKEEAIEYTDFSVGQLSAIAAKSTSNPAYAKEIKRIDPALARNVEKQSKSGQTTMPPLSDLEKKRFDIYTQLLKRAIINLPEHARDEILTRFTASIERHELNLPAPLIYERTAVRAVAAPSLERSR